MITTLLNELFPVIYSSLDNESRSNLYSSCQQQRKKILAFEDPQWIEFLSERKIEVIENQARSQSLEYLKEYCRYFFVHLEPIKKLFPLFPINVFESKRQIDAIRPNFNVQVQKLWDDTFAKNISNSEYHSQDSQPSFEDFTEEIRILLVDGGVSLNHLNGLNEAIRFGKCSREAIQLMINKGIQLNLAFPKNLIFRLLENKYPEDIIKQLIDKSAERDINSDELMLALEHKYSEDMIKQILGKIDTIVHFRGTPGTPYSCVYQALDSMYSENIIKQIMDKIDTTQKPAWGTC